MLLYGTIVLEGNTFNTFVFHNEQYIEIAMGTEGYICSAFKKNDKEEFCFGDTKAKQAYAVIKKGIDGCTAKNCMAIPFIKGVCMEHRFSKSRIDYIVTKYSKELCGIFSNSTNITIDLKYNADANAIPQLDYIRMTVAKPQELLPGSDEDRPPLVRTLEEISINENKDISWLKDKKYYIVDDVQTAEKIFQFLESYTGPISYDTETTGLRINMFCKIGSPEKRQLEEHNATAGEENQIPADRLTGIILCWRMGESFYFPCGQRFFKNIYSDRDNPLVQKTIQRIRATSKARPTAKESYMAQHIASTSDEDLTSDVILMERVRAVLENRHMVGHNAPFDWKVSFCYDIVTNFQDDTMIMHQLMYKFMDTSRNSGEPSSLKYLTKKELGIDQLDLHDFFVDYAESGPELRGKKTKKKPTMKIDFSYMNYDGAKAYAPADGDYTLCIFFKYKKALMEEFPELEYLYKVEVMTSCAIAYMEFCGHRINEAKIEQAKSDTIREMDDIQRKIREIAGIPETDTTFNLNSPAQIADLFFNRLQIPYTGDKPSVAKAALKQFKNLRNEDGTDKYPIVNLYSDWKKLSTLLVKFFDNLPNFMYPGGFIFSSFRQIETGTGRMSCSGPNAQQYPKAVTGLVIPRNNAVFLDADYSQIEYRVLVALAKEKYLADLFEDPDNDYHTLMASIMYGVPYAMVTKQMRGDAKSFNFGIPYGMGFGSLAILLKGENNDANREEAMQKYEMYFKDQPNVRAFFDTVKEAAVVNRHTRTHFGRRRYYRFTDKDGSFNKGAKARAMRQAGNAVIQGTAADIFKIAMARIYMYIRNNNLFHKVYITNMIHDECLYEIDVTKLNPKRVLRDIAECMQFKVEGFPPLFIGAGFGMDWKNAKDAYAEIHPFLCRDLCLEYKEYSLAPVPNTSPDDVLMDFANIIREFRLKKVIAYMSNPKNFGEAIHPVIGSIINSFFRMGIPLPKGGDTDSVETTMEITKRFLEEYKVAAKITDFTFIGQVKEEEPDDEYEDGEEFEDELENEIGNSEFALLDESDKVFGTSMQEIIGVYGLVISHKYRICGIDARGISRYDMEIIANYLEKHITDEEDPDGIELIILGENNILKRTGVMIKGIDGSRIAAVIKSYERVG